MTDAATGRAESRGSLALTGWLCERFDRGPDRVRPDIGHLEQVAEARLERDGDISIITAKGRSKIVEISVAEGFQTIRFEVR